MIVGLIVDNCKEVSDFIIAQKERYKSNSIAKNPFNSFIFSFVKGGEIKLINIMDCIYPVRLPDFLQAYALKKSLKKSGYKGNITRMSKSETIMLMAGELK